MAEIARPGSKRDVRRNSSVYRKKFAQNWGLEEVPRNWRRRRILAKQDAVSPDRRGGEKLEIKGSRK
jgi:hypothetical protein